MLIFFIVIGRVKWKVGKIMMVFVLICNKKLLDEVIINDYGRSKVFFWKKFIEEEV